MILYDVKRNIYVVYRSDSGNRRSDTVKKLARVVVQGQPMPGKDVAILKIQVPAEMPMLSLAPPELPQVGQQLYVYGYPGPVTNNDFVSAESAIEPTLTTGIISAIKKSVGGWPLIQMDANINHGSSGGPVCNDKGEVIGLTTFGSLENTGGLAAGLNFAVPVSILDEYLDSAGIKPVPSAITRLFADALGFYEAHQYRSALHLFERVGRLNPQYPGINTYIADCTRKIDGKGDRLGPIERLLIIFIFIGLLIAAIGAWWVRYRRTWLR
jgi:hypothetical protein